MIKIHGTAYVEKEKGNSGSGVRLLPYDLGGFHGAPGENAHDWRSVRIMPQGLEGSNEMACESGEANGQERKICRDEAQAIRYRREDSVVDRSVLEVQRSQ